MLIFILYGIEKLLKCEKSRKTVFYSPLNVVHVSINLLDFTIVIRLQYYNTLLQKVVIKILISVHLWIIFYNFLIMGTLNLLTSTNMIFVPFFFFFSKLRKTNNFWLLLENGNAWKLFFYSRQQNYSSTCNMPDNACNFSLVYLPVFNIVMRLLTA